QGITWSVAVEEQFYLFWPLIFVILPKKWWGISILSVLAGSILFRVLHYGDNEILYFHTLSVLCDLAIGGFFAYAIRTRNRIRKFFENSDTLLHAVLLGTTFVLLLFYRQVFAFPYGNAVGRIFISGLFAFIIAAQALTVNHSRLNLGNLSFARKWGKYTYGIYLIHPIAFTLLDVLIRVSHVPVENFTGAIVRAALGITLALFMSKMSYIYLESRFLKLKQQFSPSNQARFQPHHSVSWNEEVAKLA
ncbi:MAG: acyltransferase, partial [Bacteroidota bacterium]|nr:acyltransferase [Bacteroidota bacterium]